MDICKNIRKKREEKNYSQEYVAVQLGISQNAYSRLEQGLAKINVDRLIQIAEILEVDINDLLSASSNQTFNITNNQTVNGNVSNNTPIEELRILYEKLLLEKDLRIQTLESIIKEKK